MSRYAIIRAGIVENIELWDARPVRPGRTVVALTNEIVSPGDTYDGTIFTPYQPTAAEVERRDMPLFLRQRLPQLRQWSNDAKSAVEITAMTPVERIARQAVIEQRVAAMARLLMGLAWRMGEDDGS